MRGRLGRLVSDMGDKKFADTIFPKLLTVFNFGVVLYFTRSL